jgi:PAS domain S-box-containing protein
MTENARARRRTWPVVTVFLVIVGIQLLVAVVSIEILSGVRAYVSGESLYSKGQKDAQIYFLAYAIDQKEADYQRFVDALEVPMATRATREELEKDQPDLAVARQGILDSGNHPDDVGGLIRLFRWFRHVPPMAHAIASWADGDAAIVEMRRLVEHAHERIVAGDLGSPAVRTMRERGSALNKRLSELEKTFAAQLADVARQTQRFLLWANLSLAALLGLTGLGFVRFSYRAQATTETEVRRRQESLQRLLDSAAEGLFGIDVQGRCTFINRAALTMLGCAHEADLLGRDIHSMIHHSHADGRPYPASESKLSRAYREREELHVMDEVFWRRDRTPLPVEYWSHPVLEEGEVRGAVVTFFDITERLQMRAALREGEVRMTKLVDTVTDGVITVDARERVVLFNRAAERIFGLGREHAVGSSIERFLPRAASIGRASPLRQITHPHGEAQASSAVHELRGVRANGSEFPAEASLSDLRTDAGTLTTVVLRDVTELHAAREERRAREALEATSRAKTEFLSRMSHELRTPLNAVLGFSQLLRLDSVQPPSLRQLERVQHIESAGAHLLALVNDVLDLSRVEAGQMKLVLEPVHLRTVANEAVSMVSTLAAAASIDVSLTNARDAAGFGAEGVDVWVLGDRVRLRQVLVNVLSNAVKYNRVAGSVMLSWRMSGDDVQVRIADTGPGLTAEKLAHLFEPFNRLGAEKSKVEGTGIGLMLSRSLVELMGGTLEVASVVGRGTTATVVLESTDKPLLMAPPASPPSQHGALDGSLTVLYAEDNEVNVELVRQVCTFRPAVSLRIANSGAAALAMARKDPPDLLLLDMNLGDMTGLELAHELRSHPTMRHIRLVALSADALPEQISAALAFGFETYLTKPIEFRKLLNVLDGRPD